MIFVALFLLTVGILGFIYLVVTAAEGGFSNNFDVSDTVIYLRSTKTPAQHWTGRVKYDVWGVPFVEGKGTGPSWGTLRILEDGRTSDTWIYGTEWRHKSGPPVTFGKPPRNPFDEN